MDFDSILLAKKLSGGGGGSSTLIDKNISANGTYNASSDSADGYKKVVVNVPNPSTGSISITSNNTYDVTNYASAVVNVPNPSTGTLNITSNNTYDVTNYASAVVSVQGWSTNGIASRTEPSGALTFNASEVPTIKERAFINCANITSLTLVGSPYLENYAFAGCTGITEINAPSLTRIYSTNYSASSYVFQGCTGLTSVSFPSYGNYNIPSYVFQNCSNLAVADFGGGSGIQANCFGNTSALRTLVLRKSDAVTTLASWNANTLGGIYSNPSASTIYVPQSLLSSYESASNWVSAKNAGVTFAKIEGSIYE